MAAPTNQPACALVTGNVAASKSLLTMICFAITSVTALQRVCRQPFGTQFPELTTGMPGGCDSLSTWTWPMIGRAHSVDHSRLRSILGEELLLQPADRQI